MNGSFRVSGSARFSHWMTAADGRRAHDHDQTTAAQNATAATPTFSHRKRPTRTKGVKQSLVTMVPSGRR